MNQQANTKNTDINTALRNLDLPLIYYILKINTDENHAMSVADIAEQLNYIIPTPLPDDYYFSDRTVRRKLETIDFLETCSVEIIEEVNKLLHIIMGGRIEYREADGILSGRTRSNPNAQKQRRYYFVPILSSGDMNMIYGALQSNRYLSDDEKDYLVERLRILQSTFDYNWKNNTNNEAPAVSHKRVWNLNDLPQRPTSRKTTNLPVDSSTLLNHIEVLHQAIKNNFKVSIIYGTYDIDQNSSRVDFHPRHLGQASIINPYALIWNDGEYYLIATHEHYDNPVHYRVDRIISVNIHSKVQEDGYLHYVPCDKCPKSLLPYFSKEKGKTPVFDAIAYTNRYPRMIFHQEENLVNCVFECTSRSLQIIIDNFGVNVRLAQSPVDHSNDINDSDKEDNNKEPQQYITATVQKVQYENALGFALSHCQSITLLAPDNLVRDVALELEKAKAKLI